MSNGPLTLSLVIPGLLGPLPGMGAPGFPEPRWPALSKLLARSRRTPTPGGAYVLSYRIFGYCLPEMQDRPDAWLSYLADTGHVAEHAVLRADPVHLRADQHRLMLFDAPHMDIAADEADDLAAAFNAFYRGDGLQLEVPSPMRWYLHLREWPNLRTTPLSLARGRDIDPALPAGPDAAYWHRVMNEVQMLFHDHAVNRRREAQGRPLINSLWFWGGGKPIPVLPQTLLRVCSDDAVVQGLARLNGLRCDPVPTCAADWLGEAGDGRQLLLVDELEPAVAYADPECWLEAVQRLEQDWFAPLLGALHAGRLRELDLLPGNGCLYSAKRLDLWRIWRRVRPLVS